MKIIDVRSKLPVKGSNGTQNPTMIVVHHSAVMRPERYNSLDLYKRYAQQHINKGWNRLSYHYIIDNVGDVYRCNDDHQVLYHAGNLSVNRKSIAIMFDGNMEEQDLTDAQKKTYWELVEYVEKNNNITKVVGHRDIKPTACPGRYTYQYINSSPEPKPEPIQSLQIPSKLKDEFKKYGVDFGDNLDEQDLMPLKEAMSNMRNDYEEMKEINVNLTHDKVTCHDALESCEDRLEKIHPPEKELDEKLSQRHKELIGKYNDLEKKYEALSSNAPTVSQAITVLVEAIKKVWLK